MALEKIDSDPQSGEQLYKIVDGLASSMHARNLSQGIFQGIQDNFGGQFRGWSFLYGLEPRVRMSSRRMESLEGDFTFYEARITRRRRFQNPETHVVGQSVIEEVLFSQCWV